MAEIFSFLIPPPPLIGGNPGLCNLPNKTLFSFKFPLFLSPPSGAGKLQMDQPNGAAMDSLQNILVCDSKNNRIQMLSPDGVVQRALLTKEDGLKLPMAVKTDPAGFLTIAEYQGNVKTFRYMEAAVDLLPAGKFISGSPPEEPKPEVVCFSRPETLSCDSPAKVQPMSDEEKTTVGSTGQLEHSSKKRPSPKTGVCDLTDADWLRGTELSASDTLVPEDSDTVDCTTMSESVL